MLVGCLRALEDGIRIAAFMLDWPFVTRTLREGLGYAHTGVTQKAVLAGLEACYGSLGLQVGYAPAYMHYDTHVLYNGLHTAGMYLFLCCITLQSNLYVRTIDAGAILLTTNAFLRRQLRREHGGGLQPSKSYRR
jgi:hypothetical protein